MAALNVRRANFAAFVVRAMRDASSRGMTVKDIIARTKVPSATLYRWRDGDWTKDPRASLVKAFCDGLNLDLTEAHRALDWNDEPSADADLPLDPDLKILHRKLADPNTNAATIAYIRATLRYLNSLPDAPEIEVPAVNGRARPSA